ncbi:MAG: AraC family transcriptional regulator [Desulfotomaculaceae bacterium]|nr:AraC family transcriptional regulator [Desulfotomaculaceae bacterium]
MRPEIIEFAGDMPVKAHIRDVEHCPYHWHGALEIIMVLEGQAIIGIGGETHLLKENDIAVVNKNEIHRIQKSGGDNKLLMVQVDSGFCGTIPDLQYTFIHCCSPYHENQVPEKYNLLKEDVLRLVYWITEKFRKIDIIGCLDETLVEMADYFDYLRYGPGIDAFDEKRVQRYKSIYEYVVNTPWKNQSLTELAKTMGISMQYLSQDIKVKFGLTYQELLFYGKCLEAARLLLGTDKFVNEIAAECGFSDVKYLVKHFRRNFNYSPSDFRKKHRLCGEPLVSQFKYKELPLSSFREKILNNLSRLKTLNAQVEIPLSRTICARLP